jgi:hypothetical protein
MPAPADFERLPTVTNLRSRAVAAVQVARLDLGDRLERVMG